MLPGFRFLFAATVLTISIMVFGLGAAALLRTAHEQFASTPVRRAAPEPRFAQPLETATVLAALREEPALAEPKAAEPILPPAAPAEPSVVASSPAEPVISPPAEPEKVAALKPEDVTPPETAKSELPATEAAGPSPSPAPAPAETPAPDETRIAAVEPALPPPEAAAPPVPEPAAVPAASESDTAATKIATLGGPPVAIEVEPKVDSAKSDGSVVKKRKQARRARERRRLAHRARLARQVAPQQPTDAFSQPTITTRVR